MGNALVGDEHKLPENQLFCCWGSSHYFGAYPNSDMGIDKTKIKHDHNRNMSVITVSAPHIRKPADSSDIQPQGE